MVRELAIKGAPIAHVHLWGADEEADERGPRSVAYLAAMEYLRGSYGPKRWDGKNFVRANLKYDRLEAIFHPPGERLLAHLQLLEQVLSEARLSEMCGYAVRKVDMLASGSVITAVECEAAIRERHKLIAMGVERDCGLVDVLDLV